MMACVQRVNTCDVGVTISKVFICLMSYILNYLYTYKPHVGANYVVPFPNSTITSASLIYIKIHWPVLLIPQYIPDRLRTISASYVALASVASLMLAACVRTLLSLFEMRSSFAFVLLLAANVIFEWHVE